MLNAEQIAALQDRAGQLVDPIVEFLIEDIAERISEAGQLTSTAAYEVWRAQKLGMSQSRLKKEIAKRLKISMEDVEHLLTQAAEVGYDFDISRFPTVEAIPFDQNESLQQILAAAVKLTQDDLVNITQTMGFVTHDGVATELTQAYRKSCDYAFTKVVTGAQDYNSAIREAVKGLAEKGILALDYESGVHTSLEAAVRRNIMGGLGLMDEKICQQNHDDLGCDGWEISAHHGSAPDHEPIQGKQYTDAQYKSINNSLRRRIGTLNCGHSAMGIIMGVNEPQYTSEELEEMRRENEEGVTYEGKHYTLYEATQRQRKIERAMRSQKRKILIDEKTGDRDKLQADQIRLVTQRTEYKRFSEAAGLRTQHERLEVTGFGPKQVKAAEKAAKISEKMKNSIANTDTRGIMDTRGMSMGLRKPASHILTNDEIAAILADADDLGIDKSVLRMNEGARTGFVDFKQAINIRGDILPDETSTIARDRMSAKAVLAHEYYGHFLNHPSEYDFGDWRDEFRASYDAAVKAPNLSAEDRAHLMIDAYDRAREAGEFMEYDETARRLIYGY